MRDPRRWLLILVGISLVVSLIYSRSRPLEKRAHAQCLTHTDCLKAERCLIIAKGDGFATDGLCLDTCDGDLSCPAQSRCEVFFESGGFLLPAGVRGVGSQAEQVCVAGARKP